MNILGQRPVLACIEMDLRRHFKELRANKATYTSAPVFALEHHLTCAERERLGELLSDQVRLDGKLTDEFWISWVVFAAEHGYQFAGLEYWDSFERKAPRWHHVDYRQNLRKWFERFEKSYGGAKPSGSWAKKHPYISWPVTHALLPQDLQISLAQAFHAAQSHLSNASGMPDAELGRLIGRYSIDPKDRYRRFLQEEEIVVTSTFN
ncbi:hypothetical protein, partial [Xanthomonas sp. D-99]|uniref:hypothetical protein n=1 Tax=Xanthomonas sp. D-99 TaxID=2821273 RepID=UPI001ADC514F